MRCTPEVSSSLVGIAPHGHCHGSWSSSHGVLRGATTWVSDTRLQTGTSSSGSTSSDGSGRSTGAARARIPTWNAIFAAGHAAAGRRRMYDADNATSDAGPRSRSRPAMQGLQRGSATRRLRDRAGYVAFRQTSAQHHIDEREDDLEDDECDDVVLDVERALGLAELEHRLRRLGDDAELGVEREVALAQLVFVLETRVEAIEIG